MFRRATAPHPRPSTFRRVLHWAQIVLTLAVIVFWFLELRPTSLGGDASYAIVSGTSMNPIYHTGDVVVVHQHATYKVRDIVAYRVPKPSPQAGLEVIHRLIGGNGTKGWIVKGDNRTAPDQWHPKDSDIVGSAWLHVPNAGVVVQWAHSPLAIAAVLALLAVGVVFKKAPGGEKKDEPSPEPPIATARLATTSPAPTAAPSPLPRAEPEPEPEPVAAAYPSRELASSAVPLLPPAPRDDPPPAPVVSPSGAEVARLTAVVQALQVERASLHAQLDATRRELEAARLQLAASGPGSVDPVRQRELERSLTEALLSAAQAGAELRLQAHREAEAIIAEARERAAQIEQDAAGERSRAVTDLDALRATLATALASLDELDQAEPAGAPPSSPVAVVDLFEAERQRARGGDLPA